MVEFKKGIITRREGKHKYEFNYTDIDRMYFMIDGKEYARTNKYGDFLILHNFKKEEPISVNTFFLDMVDKNRYLVICSESEYYKAYIPTLSKYLSDKEYTELPRTEFNKASIKNS